MKNKTMRDRLELLVNFLIMSHRFKSRTHLCQAAGYKSANVLQRFLSGQRTELQLEFVLFLANETGVCMNWLLKGEPFLFNLTDPGMFEVMAESLKALAVRRKSVEPVDELSDLVL